jgi:predicted lipid-binding transport protein (Tim44 family)
VEFVVIWVGCAVACYFVAKSKGRNAGGWAVAGFFFSLIALLIVALLPRRQVFQHPYHSQPGTYGIPQHYNQQPGYGTQQPYPQQPLPTTAPAPAPYVVPPPIHPQHRTSAASPGPSGSDHRAPVGNVRVELARLGALHRAGQMSDADFEAARRRLLGR